MSSPDATTDAGPWVLGLGGSHNGSACLLRGSEIAVAVQRERLSGVKRDWLWAADDTLTVRYCLETAGISANDLDAIAISALPSVHDPRHDVRRNPVLGDVARRLPVVKVGHHLAHAASAYAVSGFSDAAILVVDGAGTKYRDLERGERAAASGGPGSEAISMYSAAGDRITPLAKHMLDSETGWLSQRDGGMRRFGTLGGMFSAVADQVFGDSSAAGKVMGLAACGRPTIPVEEFLVIEHDRIVFTCDVSERFRHDGRWAGHAAAYADLAASAQAALEVALGAVLADVRSRARPHSKLCYAGGVALNVVANERVVRAAYDDVFIMPAAEDSGVAVGAAYLALWRQTGAPHRRVRLRRDALGRSYSDDDIDQALRRLPEVTGRRSSDVVADTCTRLAAGQVVGWFQDGSELGPRALGHRSLLCDPRKPGAKERLNLKVKYREPFRPFAPIVADEAVGDWFTQTAGAAARFMLSALPFRADRRHRVPAVVHVDGSGRLQTVDRDDEPLMHELLTRWEEHSGVPILINTSFNLAGEPIVETADDAIRCLLSSQIDCVVLGSWIAERRGSTSLLDLRPEAGGEAVAGRPRARAVARPWGVAVVELGWAETALVASACGQLTRRQLAAAHLPGGDDRAALRPLHRLARTGVLNFDRAPSAASDLVREGGAAPPPRAA